MKLTISVLISIIGIILLSTPPTVTGALIGTTTSVSFLSQILGLILITLSIATSMTNGLEIRVTDNIKESKILLKLAKDARKNAHVRSELTHLGDELKKGNLEAGLGRQGHIEDTGIFIYVGAMVEDYTLIELGKKVIKSLVNLEKEKIKTV
ncbi:MAG: hypothetical protein AABW49_01600 [Nanoarchaeota archaeon]